jgi:signal transduction histidine kinase
MPAVITDAERLRVALVNLIVNARQAVEVEAHPNVEPVNGAVRMDASSAESRASAVVVSTRLRQQAGGRGDQAAIQVADAGVGIDDVSLTRVFDPFFTTKRGGTGLGLPIARNIVEGLGGRITVLSGVGRGTTVEIELPLTPPATAP